MGRRAHIKPFIALDRYYLWKGQPTYGIWATRAGYRLGLPPSFSSPTVAGLTMQVKANCWPSYQYARTLEKL